MTDDIKEMYTRAKKAFKEVESWPQEKVDEIGRKKKQQWHWLD